MTLSNVTFEFGLAASNVPATTPMALRLNLSSSLVAKTRSLTVSWRVLPEQMMRTVLLALPMWMALERVQSTSGVHSSLTYLTIV